jgi:hypothetical protein
MRTREVLLLATVATLVPLWIAGMTRTAGGGGAARDEARPTAVARRPAPPSPEARALAVLRRWDRLRSHAWAAGDAVSLSRLYAPGSATGARDADDLHRWSRRGLHVTGLRQQVADFRVTDRHPGRMVVVVTDRTVDGVAVGAGRRTAVPVSAWATHRISLRRSATGWRVVEVRVQPAR